MKVDSPQIRWEGGQCECNFPGRLVMSIQKWPQYTTQTGLSKDWDVCRFSFLQSQSTHGLIYHSGSLTTQRGTLTTATTKKWVNDIIDFLRVIKVLKDDCFYHQPTWEWREEVRSNLDIHCVSWFIKLPTLSSTGAEVSGLLWVLKEVFWEKLSRGNQIKEMSELEQRY